jgi:alkanesulfonate monooxygenase SsuD/methylene tetrahydromethanopterin reductase-like flavin-dependent oxidoreductase (luciferase family)
VIEIGYKLCGEETGPADLVRYARMAEETGFSFAMISDHYHPWTTGRDGARSCGASSARCRRPPSTW